MQADVPQCRDNLERRPFAEQSHHSENKLLIKIALSLYRNRDHRNILCLPTPGTGNELWMFYSYANIKSVEFCVNDKLTWFRTYFLSTFHQTIFYRQYFKILPEFSYYLFDFASFNFIHSIRVKMDAKNVNVRLK